MSTPIQDPQQIPSTEETKAQKPNDKEYNFSQLRKKQEQTEIELIREREERARLVSEFEALKAQREQDKNAQSEADDDDADDNEPYIDKKALKRHLKKLEKTNEEKIARTAEQIATRIVEQERKNNEQFRLKTLYPDFNEILNEQNIQRFTEKHPELAEKILKVQDEGLRKEMAYQTIKSLNLHKPEPPKSTVQDQINQKQRSPYYYPSSMGTPPATTGDFSEAGQKQAYEKMRSLIRNRKAI